MYNYNFNIEIINVFYHQFMKNIEKFNPIPRQKCRDVSFDNLI